MGTEPTTSERVASNVAALRAARRLTVRGLSERLSEIGHPLLPSAITKIEKGSRRVDVEDLVALAIALDVTPPRLLLPPGANDERVQLTPNSFASARTAWQWACGDRALSDPWPPAGVRVDLDRFRRWSQENRPHEPLDPTPWEVIERNRQALDEAAAAVRAATNEELPRMAVVGWIELTEKMREAGEKADDGAR